MLFIVNKGLGHVHRHFASRSLTSGVDKRRTEHPGFFDIHSLRLWIPMNWISLLGLPTLNFADFDCIHGFSLSVLGFSIVGHSGRQTDVQPTNGRGCFALTTTIELEISKPGSSCFPLINEMFLRLGGFGSGSLDCSTANCSVPVLPRLDQPKSLRNRKRPRSTVSGIRNLGQKAAQAGGLQLEVRYWAAAAV